MTRTPTLCVEARRLEFSKIYRVDVLNAHSHAERGSEKLFLIESGLRLSWRWCGNKLFTIAPHQY